MTNLLFKGKKISDGAWTVDDSFERATPDNVFVGDDRVFPESVGLFTGLFDCFNEPVFGGDILQVNASTLDIDVVIVWNKTEAKFQAERVIGGKFTDLSLAKVSHWKIIGNIFDRIHQ